MGSFGPRRVSPEDAAARFITEILKDSQRAWPQAREQLRPVLTQSLQRTPDLLEDNWTAYYFAPARLAAEMQAVRNLLPQDVAAKVIATVYFILGESQEIGQTSSEFVRIIDDRWRESLAGQENPMEAIGLTLYEALELDQTSEINGHRFVNPLVLLGLSAIPFQMGMGWWKAFFARNRIS